MVSRPGDRVGAWTLVRRTENSASGDERWSVRCDCGSTFDRNLASLRHRASRNPYTACARCAWNKRQAERKAERKAAFERIQDRLGTREAFERIAAYQDERLLAEGIWCDEIKLRESWEQGTVDG